MLTSEMNNFIDFKTVFDRVWNAALRTAMKKNNISANLIPVIKHFYHKAIWQSSSTEA